MTLKSPKSDFSDVIRKTARKHKRNVLRGRKVAKTGISTKKLAKQLETLSHTYIRKRDGINGELKGHCIDCGEYAEGQQWQAGHWEASGASGALLRYHPHNMHGQRGGCNMAYSQERVKIAYTLKMIDKYGRKYVDKLRSMKHKTIKADSIFYTKMIELYEKGDEKKIVSFLERCYNG